MHADPRGALPLAPAGRGRDPARRHDPDRVVRRGAAGHAPGPGGPGGAGLGLRRPTARGCAPAARPALPDGGIPPVC